MRAASVGSTGAGDGAPMGIPSVIQLRNEADRSALHFRSGLRGHVAVRLQGVQIDIVRAGGQLGVRGQVHALAFMWSRSISSKKCRMCSMYVGCAMISSAMSPPR